METLFPMTPPASGGPVCSDPTTVFDRTAGPFNDIPGAETYSIRQVIDAIGTGGNQVRAWFQAAAGAGTGTKHCSVGIRASGPNTTATPVELTFNDGNSGFSLTAGQSIWSDWAPLVTSSGQELIVVLDLSNSAALGNMRRSTQSAIGRYSKINTESWNQATVTTFGSPSANVADSIHAVQVRTCT